MAILEALVELDRDRPGLADRLTVALRAAIVDGRLVPGSRLPSSRDLATDLRLSRGVVVEAYEQLVAEGRLVARRGSGTTVSTGQHGIATAERRPGAVAGRAVRPGREPVPAARGGDGRGRGVTGPVAVPPGRGGVLPLRPGVPDPGAFPRAAWRRAYERALDRAGAADLDYGDPAGAPRLRAELAGYLGRVRAARVRPLDLLATTGAAQAFGLLGGALRSAGVDAVGLEDPGSEGIRGHLVAHGLRLVPIPVDDGGLDVAALARTGLRAVLVTPAHQFPTGVVLAPDRRAALLGWARRVDGLVIEDDYDAEFRYDRDPVGCLQGLAPDLVAYIGSASKALAPALRLGWLAVPPGLRSAVLAAKAAADLGGPVLEQLAFAELLAGGGYDRHLRRLRRMHRLRRDAVVTAVRRYLPAARISGVAAGLHLVVELPEHVDDGPLAEAAHRAGLGPVPLSRLRLAPGGPPGLVLGYATHPPDVLTRAVATLAELIV
ncbi:PLP-dependent aminotransferase family protein [Plantactinospora sp. S1510]|uniref:PLP-dependent aminotransferase family protein n=1 Tax=Plantactinospora alkalitolerans TaxID=2789879 RepID=A0ABS0GU99_9ACTN|nr:PLP-dependent aminotransferase family protein [Plantactinospora alkalitolerans]MBF9129775.1 PLP-dependent aminotransferase family protein [Plantactinospora alkalitolerans]